MISYRSYSLLLAIEVFFDVDESLKMLRLQLDFSLLNLALQIVSGIIFLARARNKPGRIGEHIVHFLERYLLCLWEESIEEKRICEIANHKKEVVSVLNIFHGNGGHLPDHGVKGERDTRCDGYAL